MPEERPTGLKAFTWMLRALLGVGGVVLVFVAWPVANGAWQAQKADAVFFQFRTGEQPQLSEVEAALTALDRAVAADPVAGRRLGEPRCCWREHLRTASGQARRSAPNG